MSNPPWNEEDLTSDWKVHSQYHWSMIVNGKQLDYWPTKSKFQYDGNVQTGDVYEFITSLKKPAASERDVRTIDLTPTWGEIGKLVCTLVKSSEQAALETIWPEAARAFALAAGLKAIYDELPAELKAKANEVVEVEMNKQGY